MNVWELLGEEPPALVRLWDPLPQMAIIPGRTALLVVDMEYGSVTREEGMIPGAIARGISMDYYLERLATVIPNTRRLIEAFRAASLEVAYTRGRRTKGGHRIGGVPVRPLPSVGPSGRRGIIEELAPRPTDLVIEKTTPGPFGVTSIDHALRMLGIDVLVVTGIVTDQCVEATVRGAFDHGYQVILVEDACATVSPALHTSALRVMADWFCRVWTTTETLDAVARVSEREGAVHGR